MWRILKWIHWIGLYAIEVHNTCQAQSFELKEIEIYK